MVSEIIKKLIESDKEVGDAVNSELSRQKEVLSLSLLKT